MKPLLLGMLLLTMPPVRGLAGASDETPEAILERVVKRAATLASADDGATWLYDKRSTIEELDAQGAVTNRKVKLFEVTVKGGVPDARFTGIEGRNLSEWEIREEDAAIRRRRRLFLGGTENQGPATRGTFVPADLTRRFDVVRLRMESQAGRATHVLSFKPKSPPPAAASMADRVANHLSGTVWIDDEEAELVRVEVKLDERVKLWGGILGVVDEFTYSLKRTRGREGVWRNELADIQLDARGLTKRLRFHVVEQTSRFRKAPESR